MKKITITSISLFASLFVGVNISQAEELKKEATVKVNEKIEVKPEIPHPGVPEEGPGIDPDITPVVEALKIISAADLDFGEISRSDKEQKISVQLVEENKVPWVTTFDARDSTATGWELSLAVLNFEDETAHILKGAQLHLTGLNYYNPREDKGVPEVNFEVNEKVSINAGVVAPTSIAKATRTEELEQGVGTWTLLLGDQPEELLADTTDDVQLIIPARTVMNTGAEYTAELMWTLSDAP